MEEAYLPHPLNIYHVQKFQSFINRIHMLLHSTSLLFLFYYRLCFLFQGGANRKTPFFLWLLIFLSETILSFIWILGIGYRWRPVSRAVFPERLPEEDDELLPPIDVFICTVDPTKEPTEDVMNTVLSAMSLDYPPDRLHVYVSDDGGSSETLRGMREAWRFARWWLPFCRKYKIKRCCPKVYFSDAACEISDDGDNSGDNIEFVAEKRKIKKKYDAFVEEIMRVKESRDICGGAISHDHPSLIEVIEEDNSDEEEGEKVKLPHLVYVCREKRPSHPHNFKAGALNVLLRVSAVMSNAPYFLVLDCDMFCNDPTSARKALCFHLDPKISKSLAFVQFPHKFQNITNNDIYDSQLRSAFKVLWQGLDGLQGPVLSGTCFYAKRASLCGNYTFEDAELIQLQQKFGSSNEFIKALKQSYTPNLVKEALVEETKLLASCNYEIGTKWGQEVGFFYASVVEDVLTGLMMHCNGWTSVFCDPFKQQFLGTATTNLNDLLIQGTRWSSGLFEIGLSKFCPLICGPFRISLLQRMCFAELTFFPLYCLPLYCFATIPQLCLLHGISLYPKVSDPYFFIFSFIFLSALSKHLQEVLTTGGSFQKWINEQRIWMMKSTTCHLYGCLDALLKKLGLREASFLPTNKVEDDEQITILYKRDKFDFRTSNMFLVPMLALVSLNISCLIGGVYKVVFVGNWEEMFIQILLSAYIIIVNYPIIEGLLIRRDKGHIPSSVLPSFVILAIVIQWGFSLLLRSL